LEILETDDESITIDMNHSMAGKTLTFDIELVEIKDKSETNNLPNFDLSTEEIDNIGELNNNIVE
jgi:FKBP-type peptidyl-prolyl cis-trans isomerase 2